MKLKNKTKFLLVLGIVFVAFLLFNTNNVNAAEISDYKCKIEKDGYILYNNYFNTKDVTFESKTFGNQKFNYINMYNVDKATFNKVLKEWEEKEDSCLALVELTNDVDKVKEKYSQKELEIIVINNKKYAMYNCGGIENTDAHISLYGNNVLEIIKNEITETKEISYFTNVYNTDYFRCETRVVSENGVVYGICNNTNGYVNGMGLESLPEKLDLSKSYVEYLTNTYIGETLKIDSLGNVPYVGKYGNQYKYKMSLKNAKIDETGALNINEFSYKDSIAVGDFYLDPSYTINNETYVENKQTNTSTKLKFDLQGNFKGTLKAEAISKNDLIYNKVNEELKKYSEDNVYMNISNIYIENGSYEGPLKLTFYVGEQYNGKYYSICHMKNYYYEFEEFEGIVENGKIEITVDSLSPFGILIADKKEETQTPSTDNNNNNKPVEETTKPTQVVNKGEKDVTPKTGTVDIIGYVLVATTIAGIGIVALKKKLK